MPLRCLLFSSLNESFVGNCSAPSFGTFSCALSFDVDNLCKMGDFAFENPPNAFGSLWSRGNLLTLGNAQFLCRPNSFQVEGLGPHGQKAGRPARAHSENQG